MQPTYIYHADWGTAANKRRFARVILGVKGRYTAHVPTRIENHTDLIPRILRDCLHF
jgi:hypothetical protein